MTQFLNRRRFTAGVALAPLAAGGLLAGCSGMPDTVRIGVAQPLSGPLAALGQDLLNGVMLAVKELNANNFSVDGKRVALEVVTVDDKADAEVGKQVAQQLVDGGICAVIGHLNSGVSIAAAPIYAGKGIAQIAISTNPKYTDLGFPTTLRMVAGLIEPTSGEIWFDDQDDDADRGTVVLLHGFLATSGLNWMHAYAPLGQHFRVIAPDLCGHGGDAFERRNFTLEHCADDVAALIAILGLKQVIVVGYSMGGMVAQLVARRHGALIGGMVLSGVDWGSREYGRVSKLLSPVFMEATLPAHDPKRTGPATMVVVWPRVVPGTDITWHFFFGSSQSYSSSPGS